MFNFVWGCVFVWVCVCVWVDEERCLTVTSHITSFPINGIEIGKCCIVMGNPQVIGRS